MGKLIDTTLEFVCINPICKNKLHLKYSEVVHKGRIKCMRCNSETIFAQASRTSFQKAITDYERAEKKLEEALDTLLSKAQMNIR